MQKQTVEIIALPGLLIRVDPAVYMGIARRAFETTIEVKTGVFDGGFKAYFREDEFLEFQKSLRSLSVPGTVKLGDGENAEIGLQVEKQIAGEESSLVLTVSATTCGESPWPKLSYLIFDVPAQFAQYTMDAI